MCGRFVSATAPAVIAAHFGAELLAEPASPRFNVTPGSAVLVVHGDGPRVADTMRWGLVPSWADSPAVGSRMINARSETMATKPSFRRAVRTRRCIIPADGFYEWQAASSHRGPKQPWYFTAADGAPLAMAGLWETWSPAPGDSADQPPPVLVTCTIVTTDADDVVAPVHHRMPVLFDPDGVAAWLDPGCTRGADAHAVVAERTAVRLAARTVSTAVNNPTHDGPELITPAGGGPDHGRSV